MWIKRHPRSIRYWLSIVAFIVAILLLAALSLDWIGLLELRDSLSTNLLSEVIGALLIAFLLEGVLKRASEERQAELAEIAKQRAELEEYRAVVEEFIEVYRGANPQEVVKRIEAMEAVHNHFSAKRAMQAVVDKAQPDYKERTIRAVKKAIEALQADDSESD